jgi:hypothetical protein
MLPYRTTLIALALALGLLGEVAVAAAEGEGGPPRIVIVESAGKGAERQTTVMSSNNPTARVVPSSGRVSSASGAAAAPSRPPAAGAEEAVLGERASRPAPAPRPSDDLLGGMIGAVATGVLGPAPADQAAAPGGAGAALSAREDAAAASAMAASLPPEQLRCVQDALGRAVQTGLIVREQPSIGASQMAWVAGQCQLDMVRLAPIVARALGEARAGAPEAAAPRPVASPEAASVAPAPPAVAEPAQRASWQRSVLDDPEASARERLAQMRAANQPAHEETGLPIWQIALLGLIGLAGLGGAAYGMAWLARPRYVVRVVPARPRGARRR